MSFPSIARVIEGTEVVPGIQWTDGVCARSDDPEAWFPDPRSYAAIDRAKEGCNRCPLKQQCLDMALRTGERFGVWGGEFFG